MSRPAASRPTTDDQALLTFNQALKYLGVGKGTLNRAIKDGWLPVAYLDSWRRFRRQDLDTYIARRLKSSPPP